MSFSFHDHTAVFGGSFSPPHLGHSEAVQSLFKNPGVKRVLMVPSFGTPLKSVNVSFSARYEMTKLAFQEIKAGLVEVSDVEATHQIAFSWQLLELLTPQLGSKITFVIGADQFQKLSSWARYPQVMSLCDWIVLLRKPTRLNDLVPHVKQYVSAGWLKAGRDESNFEITNESSKPVRHLRLVTTEAREISATEIRKNLALGKKTELSEMISAPVLSYIERNRLYGT